MSTLASTLEEVRERIRRAAKQSLNEQNTKATLIEPVLHLVPQVGTAFRWIAWDRYLSPTLSNAAGRER